MTAEQLALFPQRRQLGAGHFDLTGIAAAGWRSGGQFHYDVRRWVAGEDLDLTDTQVAYLTNDR